MAPIANEYPQRELVDFDSGGLSRNVTIAEKIDYDGVILARCVLQPNGGGPIAFSKTTVAIHDSAPIEMEWRTPDGDGLHSSLVRRGGAMLVNAGLPVWKRWITPRTIFAFAVSDSFVDRVWRSAFDGVGDRAVRTTINADDPILARLCDIGRREMKTGGVGGRLYIDAVATALTVHLLRKHGAVKRPPVPHKGGLAPARLRRVLDFIAAHLEDEIALADLAAVAELSPHHFGEAFKTATGRPPYRYVMERRVDRARNLLTGDKRSIAEIACATGFSSQQHLTTNFRRLTGVTPARFRRSLS